MQVSTALRRGRGGSCSASNFRKPLLTGFNKREYNHIWHRGASCVPWPAPWRARRRYVGPARRQQPARRAPVATGLPRLVRRCARHQRRERHGGVAGEQRGGAAPLCRARRPRRDAELHGLPAGPGLARAAPRVPVRPASAHTAGPGRTWPVLDKPERFKGLWSQADVAAAPPPPPPTPADLVLAPGTSGVLQSGDNSLTGVQATADSSSFK